MCEDTAVVVGFNSIAECYKRRQNLVFGYLVREHDSHTGIFTIDIYAVQNGRTNTLLGTLQMKEDEWRIFHSTVFQLWENLQYPKPNNEECI